MCVLCVVCFLSTHYCILIFRMRKPRFRWLCQQSKFTLGSLCNTACLTQAQDEHSSLLWTLEYLLKGLNGNFFPLGRSKGIRWRKWRQPHSSAISSKKKEIANMALSNGQVSLVGPTSFRFWVIKIHSQTLAVNCCMQSILKRLWMLVK